MKRFRDLLPASAQQQLSREGSLLTFGHGELIQKRGDTSSSFAMIQSGTVKGGIYGSDGRYVMTSLLWPGDTFGEFTLFANLPRVLDLYAFGEAVILAVPGPTFKRLFREDADISTALLRATMIRTHTLLDSLDKMKRLPLLERTAHFLLAMDQGASDGLSIPLTQSDIAHSLGTSRVSINRTLKALRELALIELEYGSVSITDRSRLVGWLHGRQ